MVPVVRHVVSGPFFFDGSWVKAQKGLEGKVGELIEAMVQSGMEPKQDQHLCSRGRQAIGNRERGKCWGLPLVEHFGALIAATLCVGERGRMGTKSRSDSLKQ